MLDNERAAGIRVYHVSAASARENRKDRDTAGRRMYEEEEMSLVGNAEFAAMMDSYLVEKGWYWDAQDGDFEGVGPYKTRNEAVEAALEQVGVRSNPAMSTTTKVALGALLVAGAGGAAWYFTKKKPA